MADLPNVFIASNSKGDQIVTVNGLPLDVRAINITKHKGQPLMITLCFDANLVTQHSDDFYVEKEDPNDGQ